MTSSEYTNKYLAQRQTAYTPKGASLFLGKPKVGEDIVDVQVRVPLSTLNRHGLIAGATGTGKTKSLQVIAEQLSQQWVPTLLMDIKWDLSGIAMPGDATNIRIQDRFAKLASTYEAFWSPVEFLSISQEPGARVRTTVTELGPILMSKMLELNDTQSEIMWVIFQFCDQNQLALVDLTDLKAVIQYISDEGKDIFTKNYWHTSPASLTTILRSVINLEQQDGATFFGEPSFDINDLLQQKDGKGIVNILRLTDMQRKPMLFSVTMLSLLGELFHTLPEAWDLEKPKLVVFLDEAHLIFKDASKELLETLETTMKLIRSKWVGIIFCTQLPDDIPDAILSQLGLRVQHALRAITAKDRETIEKAAKNFPETDVYDIANDITALGIWEAFVTCLDEKWIPTPLVWTYMVSPASRMDILTPSEIDTIMSDSLLAKKYAITIDPESAYEILEKKLENDDKTTTDDTTKSNNKDSSTKENTSSEDSPFMKALTKVTTKVATNLAKWVWNGLIRWLFGKIGIKIDGRRTFF